MAKERSQADIDGWLSEGFRLHQAGQFTAAQEYYRNILEQDSNHADALFLLGTTYLQLGNPQECIDWMHRALAVRPDLAGVHINLANAYQAVGKKSMAITHFEKAIEIEPNNQDAHYNLAINLSSQGLYRDAVEHYLEAIKIKPDHVGALNNVGIIFQAHDKHDEAIQYFQTALKFQETNTDANYNLANSLHAQLRYDEALTHYQAVINVNPKHWLGFFNLGLCYEKLHRIKDAVNAFEEVIKLNPNHGESYYLLGKYLQLDSKFQESVDYYQLALDRGVSNKFIYCYAGSALEKLENYEGAVNAYYQAIALDPENEKIYLHLGDSLQQLQRYEEAVLQYEQALVLNPRNEEVLNNLGCALGSMGRYEESIAYLSRALSVKTDYIQAYNNLGCTLMEINKLKEAIEQFNNAIALQPNYKDGLWNKGLAYLCQGKLAEGFPLYEYRTTAVKNLPLSTYENLFFGVVPKQNKKLFIESEQGFGDIIQILRYVNLVLAKDIECWIKVPPVLHTLTQRSFPKAHVLSDEQDAPPPDVPNNIALMSLPLMMKTISIEDIPGAVPYLVPDAAKTTEWNKKLPSGRKKRVGIFWRGMRKARNNNRSLQLSEISPLFSNEDIQFIALQKNITTPEFIALRQYKNVTLLEYDLVDFDETAAVMANLDLMISIDSAPVHMAGAVGIQTWALLPFAVDWRWMSDRTDSPWYPNTTLFRQKQPGDWEGVIKDVKKELDNLAG